MHPDLLGQVTRERISDMHREAINHRVPDKRASRPQLSLKKRTGWMLIDFGLRLAASSARSAHG
jgi:hypothetical protein